jgi:predicted nuclease with RNAse H fold
MGTSDPHLYLGIDVQTERGCPYATLDAEGEPVEAGWVSGSARQVVTALDGLVQRLVETRGGSIVVGIDAPRRHLPSPRKWYWDGPRKRWRLRRSSDLGNGRHCEIVIAAHRLANPQWTPHRPPFPAWMRLGFALFAVLEMRASVYEVFPSASYTLLEDSCSLKIGVRLNTFAQGPKDMLDAYVAAASVREYTQGRGDAVGGGDALGEIILPRPLPKPIDEVLRWPGDAKGDGESGARHDDR